MVFAKEEKRLGRCDRCQELGDKYEFTVDVRISMTGYGTSLHCYVVRPPTYIYYKADLQFVHTMVLAVKLEV